MCISPLKIQSRKYNYRAGTDKAYISVPCGHCFECRRKKGSDLYVRAYYEFMNCKDNFFVTLTYNKANLPRYNYASMSIDGYEVPQLDGLRVFNKQDVISFCKQLCQYLAGRSSIDLAEYGLKEMQGIKYIIIPEFGADKDKTMRAHYHCLFFLPESFTVSGCSRHDVFLRLCQLAWSDRKSFRQDVSDNDRTFINKYLSKYVEDAIRRDGMYISYQDFRFWQKIRELDNPYFILLPPSGSRKSFRYMSVKGYASFSLDEENKCVRPRLLGPHGCKYLMKYMTKNSYTYMFKHLDALVKWKQQYRKTHAEISKIKKEDRELKDEQFMLLWKKISYCLPFVVLSKGFGEQLFFDLKEKSKLGKYEEVIQPLSLVGDDYTRAVPQYVINRLYYDNLKMFKFDSRDMDPDYDTGYEVVPVRFLNDVGFDCTKLKYNLRIEQMVMDFKKYFDKKLLDAVPFKSLDCSDLYHSRDDMYIDIQSQLNKISFDNLSRYALVFAGVENLYKFSSVDEAMQYVQDLFDIEADKRKYFKGFIVYDDTKFCNQHHNNISCYDTVYPFDTQDYSYRFILNLFYYIKTNVSNYFINLKKEQLEKDEELKKFRNTVIYGT